MEANRIVPDSIDEYISNFPSDIRQILLELRKVIKETAPGAMEKISYQMPAFEFHGNLVYFAAYKKHIGFYPTPSGISAFKHELSGYKKSKGAVQFPLDKPLPYELIKRIVEFRVKENIKNSEIKSSKKTDKKTD